MNTLSRILSGARSFRLHREIQLKDERVWDALATSDTLDRLEFNNTIHVPAELLAHVITQSKTLQHLELSFVRIGPNGIGILADAIKSNDTLQHLGICHVAIGRESFIKLTEALKVHPSLKRLRLQFNQVNHIGAQLLASALEHNVTLRQLEIRGNTIGDIGMRAICRVLHKNCTLTSLRLISVSSERQGYHALADMLRVNTTLKHLNYQNRTSGDSANNLLLQEGLEANTGLTTLVLDQDRATRELIQNVLIRNRNIRHVKPKDQQIMRLLDLNRRREQHDAIRVALESLTPPSQDRDLIGMIKRFMHCCHR